MSGCLFKKYVMSDDQDGNIFLDRASCYSILSKVNLKSSPLTSPPTLLLP